VRFHLTDELLEHEKVHEMLDELIDKPPVVPLSQDNSGYGTYLLEFRFEYLVYVETPRALVHLYFLRDFLNQ
jgi:hypothetical protein